MRRCLQLCDIKLPEIETMLAKLPTSTTYDHKMGWLPPKFQDQCREIASKYITERIRADILTENESSEKTSTKKHGSTSKHNAEDSFANDVVVIDGKCFWSSFEFILMRIEFFQTSRTSRYFQRKTTRKARVAATTTFAKRPIFPTRTKSTKKSPKKLTN